MTSQQKMVRDFHHKFMLKVGKSPAFPTISDIKLRMALEKEEEKELNEATTVEEAMDAIGDWLYVVLGTAVTYGVDIEPVFEEIHRSNMTKLWTTDECRDLAETHPKWMCTLVDFGNQRPWLVKNEIGKVVKSPSYSPADLKPILAKQLAT